MFRSLDNSLLRRVLIQTYWGLYVYEYLQEWKQGGIDKVEGVETIDQVHLEPHEYQAEEEVEPQGAQDPGDGIEDHLPGDGEVDHNKLELLRWQALQHSPNLTTGSWETAKKS